MFSLTKIQGFIDWKLSFKDSVDNTDYSNQGLTNPHVAFLSNFKLILMLQELLKFFIFVFLQSEEEIKLISLYKYQVHA